MGAVCSCYNYFEHSVTVAAPKKHNLVAFSFPVCPGDHVFSPSTVQSFYIPQCSNLYYLLTGRAMPSCSRSLVLHANFLCAFVCVFKKLSK